MSADTPGEVTNTVAAITDLLTSGVRVGGGSSSAPSRRESLDQGYRWVYATAFGLASTEPPSSTVCGKCHGTTITPQGKRCDECAPGRRGDRTGDAVVNRQRQIDVADQVTKRINTAKQAITEAVALIRGETERGRDPAPVPLTEARVGVDEALAAASRRAQREEGWGSE